MTIILEIYFIPLALRAGWICKLNKLFYKKSIRRCLLSLWICFQIYICYLSLLIRLSYLMNCLWLVHLGRRLFKVSLFRCVDKRLYPRWLLGIYLLILLKIRIIHQKILKMKKNTWLSYVFYLKICRVS
jgi:hypothetical protein